MIKALIYRISLATSARIKRIDAKLRTMPVTDIEEVQEKTNKQLGCYSFIDAVNKIRQLEKDPRSSGMIDPGNTAVYHAYFQDNWGPPRVGFFRYRETTAFKVVEVYKCGDDKFILRPYQPNYRDND